MSHTEADGDQGSTRRGSGPGVSPPPSEWPTGRLLSAAARRVGRGGGAYLAGWSLTHASLPVLAVLVGGSRSQRELARELHVTEQTTSRMLAGLERIGYVNREPHAADRRRRTVALTDAGWRALDALNDPGAIEMLVGSALDAEQLSELRRLLVQLVEAGPSGGNA